MVEDEPANTLLGELYDAHCLKGNREWDEPIRRWREARCDPAGEILKDPNGEKGFLAYQENLKTAPDTLLQFCLARSATSVAHLAAIKRSFLHHAALSGVMGYMLNIGGRTPYKFMFSRSTGRIVQLEFFPTYEGRDNLLPGRLIDQRDNAPFRLTRNIETAVGPVAVEGLFATVMTAFAQSLAIKGANADDLFQAFFRDELVALHEDAKRHVAKTGLPTTISAPSTLRELQTAVAYNSANVLRRINEMAPRDPYLMRQVLADRRLKTQIAVQREQAAAAAARAESGVPAAPAPMTNLEKQLRQLMAEPDPMMVPVQKKAQDLVNYAKDAKMFAKCDVMFFSFL